MNTREMITLARKHIHNGAAMESSALLCLTDAITWYDEGNYKAAAISAERSLSYSVGVFHKDYKRASII